MDEFVYLRQCDDEEVLNTWNALGGMVVNKDTKLYVAGSVVRIDASNGDGLSKAPLHNRIMYIQETYRVDNKTKYPINWEDMTEDDIEGIYAAVQGVQLQFFGLLKTKWSAGFVPDKNFLPYTNENIDYGTAGINISNIELDTILTVIGLPLVSFDDLEYSKSQIISLMVRPALQRYYTYRPIIHEDGYGIVAQNQEFCVPFPENAHGCIPIVCSPGGSTTAYESRNPFTAYAQRSLATGMGGSRFNRPIAYRGKAVPGYTGGDKVVANMLDDMAARQGMINYFKRQHYHREKINGVLYATGFTTVGGMLNFKWLCNSKDWDDIPFEDLEVWARPMVRSEVLRNFTVIRSLVKTDIAGQLDPNVFKELRQEIEQELLPKCKAVGTTGALAVQR